MWRRLWSAWACIIALAFVAGTASAASSAPAKPHQGTSEFSAALNVCANALTTIEAHSGKARLPTTETSDVPDAARGAGPALQAARAGGRHAGQLQQFLKQTPDQLRKTIGSFDKQIAKHQGWIRDPASKVKDWATLRPEHQQNLLHHWRQDIARHHELKSIAEDLLKGL